MNLKATSGEPQGEMESEKVHLETENESAATGNADTKEVDRETVIYITDPKTAPEVGNEKLTAKNAEDAEMPLSSSSMIDKLLELMNVVFPLSEREEDWDTELKTASYVGLAVLFDALRTAMQKKIMLVGDFTGPAAGMLDMGYLLALLLVIITWTRPASKTKVKIARCFSAGLLILVSAAFLYVMHA